jgi:hypothetical protein
MRALFLFAATLAVAAADCDHYNDCLSCAGARGWTGQCRWYVSAELFEEV